MRFVAGALLALAGYAVAQVGPGKVTGDISVHDPTMCKDNTGTYFIFGASACILVLAQRMTDFRIYSDGHRPAHPYVQGPHCMDSNWVRLA